MLDYVSRYGIAFILILHIRIKMKRRIIFSCDINIHIKIKLHSSFLNEVIRKLQYYFNCAIGICCQNIFRVTWRELQFCSYHICFLLWSIRKKRYYEFLFHIYFLVHIQYKFSSVKTMHARWHSSSSPYLYNVIIHLLGKMHLII